MEYLCRSQPEHELAARGARCIMLGLATYNSPDSFWVRDITEISTRTCSIQ